MKLMTFGGIVAFILAIVLSSCAPSAAPPPAPAPAPQSAPAAPALTPQEAAWQKVEAAAKREGTLTVYSFWWVGDTGIAMARAFRQRYGIEAQVITGRGAEFIERLKVEKRIGKVTADVFEGSATHSQNVKLEGLLGSVADLPILQEKAGWNFSPLVFDPEAYILLHRPWIMVPFINTNLVKAADIPKSWNDLLLPRWKGNIITPDPNVSNSTYYLLFLVTKGIVGKDFIPRLGQQELRYTKDSSDAARAIARGEAALYTNATDSSFAPFAQAGAPVKAVEVEKGAIVSGGVIDWVKDGPHPNAAKVFINWSLSDEGQRVEAEVSGTVPMRQAVPDFRHPAIRSRANQPVIIGLEENQEIAKAFREKVMVDLLGKR